MTEEPAKASMVMEGEDKARLEGRQRSRAIWFFAIAGVTLVNTLLSWLGIDWQSGWRFPMGLSTAQLVDLVAEIMAEQGDTLIPVVFTLLSLAIAGAFVTFGLGGRKGSRGSFIFGITLYALDWLVSIYILYSAISTAVNEAHFFARLGLENLMAITILREALNVIGHLVALWGLYGGLVASNNLNTRSEREQDSIGRSA